jgi:hypothetical protein
VQYCLIITVAYIESATLLHWSVDAVGSRKEHKPFHTVSRHGNITVKPRSIFLPYADDIDLEKTVVIYPSITLL